MAFLVLLILVICAFYTYRYVRKRKKATVNVAYKIKLLEYLIDNYDIPADVFEEMKEMPFIPLRASLISESILSSEEINAALGIPEPLSIYEVIPIYIQKTKKFVKKLQQKG